MRTLGAFGAKETTHSARMYSCTTPLLANAQKAGPDPQTLGRYANKGYKEIDESKTNVYTAQKHSKQG